MLPGRDPGRAFGPVLPPAQQQPPRNLRPLHGDRIPFQLALVLWCFTLANPGDRDALVAQLTHIRDAVRDADHDLVLANFKNVDYGTRVDWQRAAEPWRAPCVFRFQEMNNAWWFETPFPFPTPEPQAQGNMFITANNVPRTGKFRGLRVAIRCVADVLLEDLANGISQARRLILYQAGAPFKERYINRVFRWAGNEIQQTLYKRFQNTLFPQALRYITDTLAIPDTKMGITKKEDVSISGPCYVSFDRAGKWHDAFHEVVTVPAHRIPNLRIMINPFAVQYTIEGPVKSPVMLNGALLADARAVVVFLESSAQMSRAEIACAADKRVLRLPNGAYDVIRPLLADPNPDRAASIRLAAIGSDDANIVVDDDYTGAAYSARPVLGLKIGGRGFIRDCDYQVRSICGSRWTIFHAQEVVHYVNREFGANFSPATLTDDQLDAMYARVEDDGNQARDGAHNNRVAAFINGNDGERQRWEVEINNNMPRVRIIGDCDAGGMQIVVQQMVGMPHHPVSRTLCLPDTEYAGPFPAHVRARERILLSTAGKRKLLRTAHMLRGATVNDVPYAPRVLGTILDIIRDGAFSAASHLRAGDGLVFDQTLANALSPDPILHDPNARELDAVVAALVQEDQQLPNRPAAPANQNVAVGGHGGAQGGAAPVAPAPDAAAPAPAAPAPDAAAAADAADAADAAALMAVNAIAAAVAAAGEPPLGGGGDQDGDEEDGDEEDLEEDGGGDQDGDEEDTDEEGHNESDPESRGSDMEEDE